MTTGSVDGLVSGLNTSQIISQLMNIERQSQVRLESQRASVQREVGAYQALNTKFAALRDAARELATRSSWQAAKATSDSTSVVATAAQGAQTGSFTFTVRQLATAHTQVSASTVASTSTIVTTGPLTITKDGVPVTVDTGDGSLASVVDAINRADAGVRAAAVQVGTNQYRLQLTSTTGGAASSFAVDTTNFTGALGALNVMNAGQDALIDVGDPLAGGYTITSASNTVTGVLTGVTLTLKKADAATPVTVTVETDAEALADKVKAMIDAANAALADIRTFTAYDASTRKGGPLVGDGRARQLQQFIANAVSSVVRAGGDGSATLAGVSFTRSGTVTFDRTKFLAAFAADPESIADLFRQSGSATTTSLSLSTAGDRTQAGTYAVTTTVAAARASATGAVVAGGTIAADETIEISSGGITATYAATAGESLASIASGLNGAFASAGVDVAATVESGALVLRSNSYGSAATFTVVSAGAGAGQTELAAGAYAGTDVAGSFTLGDGTVVAGTGRGQILSAPTGHATLDGLALKVTAGTAGAIGSFTYEPGVAARLQTAADLAIDVGTGVLTLAIEGRQSQIDRLGDRIADWDERLRLRETALRRQFSNLESLLGQLQNQSTWLSGQIAGLVGGQG